MNQPLRDIVMRHLIKDLVLMPEFYRAVRVGRIWLEPQSNGPCICRHVACSDSLQNTIRAFERLQVQAQHYFLSGLLLLSLSGVLLLMQLVK